MGFGEAVRLFFNRYTDFQGRSRRAEYWWVVLAQSIFYVIAVAIYMSAGGSFDPNTGLPIFGGSSLIFSIPFILIWLGLLIPNIALNVRRFHDLGQTGWLVLVFTILGRIPIVTFVAGIVQLIWFIFPGTSGPNKYGPDPKTGIDVDAFS